MGIFGSSKPNVEELESRQDIAGLIGALLYDKDPDLPAKASEALLRIGEPALQPLIEALKSDLEPQPQVARILRSVGGAAGTEALEAYSRVPALISDALELERRGVITGAAIDRFFAAVDELGEIGDMRAVESLNRLLKVTKGGARTRVASALAKIDTKNAERYSQIAVSEVEEALRGLRSRMSKM